MPEVQDIKDMTPNARLVERLQELLEEAEKGELRHMLYVGGYEDASVCSSWVTDERAKYVAGRAMLGELGLLTMDFGGMLMRTEPERWVVAEWINGDI